MTASYPERYSYKQKAVLFILMFTALRCFLSFTMALGVDESYYWTYSQHLKLNYFDHPPLVAIFIRLTTFNLLLDSIEGCVRLGSVLGCALSSWFIFKTCSILHSEKAGFFGVCLYNASFYATITSGLFIMPDSPQMVFFTLSMWLLVRITLKDKNWLNWILFGIASGLCIMSKVHGVFLWVGLGLYIIFLKKSWFRRPQLYAAVLISLIISCPILIWNIQNEFVAYKFHSNRVKIEDEPIKVLNVIREAVSQLLYNNPFNVILFGFALHAYAQRIQQRAQALSIFNLVGLPLALLLLVIALFRDTTLPHWSGPAYIVLVPSASIFLASSYHRPFVRVLFKSSVTSIIVILLLGKAALHFYPGELGETLPNVTSSGKSSNQNKLLKVFNGFASMQLVTEPLNGWTEARKKFDSLYQQDILRGFTKIKSPVICSKWQAAQVEYYFCRGSNRQMIGLGSMYNLHEYLWTNRERQDEADFSNGYFISSEMVDAGLLFAPYYSHVVLVTTLDLDRNLRPPLKFHVYRLSGWRNNLPVAMLTLQ